MAASNAPKHDFAPSWLKIPNENSRPNGSKGSYTPDRNRQQRRDENYHNRYGGEYPRGLNRQNSFDVYESSSKRYSPSHGAKYRGHPVEDDYFYSSYSYGYPPYYPFTEPYMQFGSQPSLRRDMKYAPPPPQGRFPQVNANYQGFGYPPFYDFFPHGEGFNTYGNGGVSTGKRSHYAKEGREESKESKDSDRSSHDGDDKDKIFNDDFPSLNGTDEDGDAKASKNTGSSGVWDNPPRSTFDDGADYKNSTTGIHKVVPSKAMVTNPASSGRKGGRDNVRMNGSLRDMSPLSSKTSSGRDGLNLSNSSQPMEILSTRLVRPKPSDMKKSQFLKELKDSENCITTNGVSHYHLESNNNVRKGEEELNGDVESMMNGLSDLHLDHDSNGSSILSSSMEKEYSFMRSLGWSPNDAEFESEITEEEKKEFLRMSQQQHRNGPNRMLPKTWSPQHLKPAQSKDARSHQVNESLSSDTDSGDDA